MADEDRLKRIESTLTRIWNRQNAEHKDLNNKHGSLLDFIVKHDKRLKELEKEVAALRKGAAKSKKATAKR